ncbi:hypothetical protein LOW90_001568, partial [Campylobacter jejuni]|nr:hypothetical protein [Campylobacter jejuni]
MQDKLIVAARSDAFGERMLNFLNAIYLSSKVGLKFGYIWPEYFYRWSKEELLARNIIREGSDLFTEEELFSKQFIKEYSYANKLKTNEGELFIQSEGIFLKDQVYHLTEFVKDPQYSWGWSSTQFDLSILFPEIDTREYHSELRKIWQKLTLDFCDDAKDSLRFAMHVSNQLGDNFISIHLRSGGFVYDDRMVARFGVRKAVPIHLVLDVIQQKNKDYSIVIFGDDLDSIRQLKEYCFFSLNLSNIFIVDDFTNHNFSRKQQTLFELILLSMSLEIYTSGRSGFSNLANILTRESKLLSLYEIYSKEEQLKIISSYVSTIQFHHLQQAFSYLHLYLLSKELKHPLSEQQAFLEETLKLDPNNIANKILLLYNLLLQKKYSKADFILENIFLNNHEKDLFMYILFQENPQPYGGGLFYSYVMPEFLKVDYIFKFPYL